MTNDLHAMKGVEDAVRRNVQTNVDYSKSTRAIVRELEAKIVRLENIVLTNNALVALQQQQIGLLQSKVLNGGPTDGN